MPEGPGELAWRKLQNEVQMQWFAESLNEQREMRGQKAINSIWIWGGADAGVRATTPTPSASACGWLRAFGEEGADGGAAQVAQGSGHRLLVLDALAEAALAEEWGLWLQHLEHLDRDWLAPLLGSLKAGSLESLNLILTGADRSQEVAVTRGALRRFWRKASLGAGGA
jgi:hypothetical protein